MSLCFFTDRDLGKRFPEILVSAGWVVEQHFDLFEHNCPDEKWLKYVGENGRVAITHDTRIRYKPNELAAVNRHGVSLLVVIGNAPYPVLARHFVLTMPRILAFLKHHAPPFIAKVYRPAASEIARDSNAQGSVSLWYPE